MSTPLREELCLCSGRGRKLRIPNHSLAVEWRPTTNRKGHYIRTIPLVDKIGPCRLALSAVVL